MMRQQLIVLKKKEEYLLKMINKENDKALANVFNNKRGKLVIGYSG